MYLFPVVIYQMKSEVDWRECLGLIIVSSPNQMSSSWSLSPASAAMSPGCDCKIWSSQVTTLSTSSSMTIVSCLSSFLIFKLQTVNKIALCRHVAKLYYQTYWLSVVSRQCLQHLSLHSTSWRRDSCLLCTEDGSIQCSDVSRKLLENWWTLLIKMWKQHFDSFNYNAQHRNTSLEEARIS